MPNRTRVLVVRVGAGRVVRDVVDVRYLRKGFHEDPSDALGEGRSGHATSLASTAHLEINHGVPHVYEVDLATVCRDRRIYLKIDHVTDLFSKSSGRRIEADGLQVRVLNLESTAAHCLHPIDCRTLKEFGALSGDNDLEATCIENVIAVGALVLRDQRQIIFGCKRTGIQNLHSNGERVRLILEVFGDMAPGCICKCNQCLLIRVRRQSPSIARRTNNKLAGRSAIRLMKYEYHCEPYGR